MCKTHKLISDAPNGKHFVQVHQTAQDLIEAVSQYAEKGLKKQETVILVGTNSNLLAIRKSLGSGQDLKRLVLRDAEEMLAKFMEKGMPNWEKFRDVIGGTIENYSRQGAPKIRIWGEMVNQLWEGNRIDAAVRLEEMWNDLAEECSFSLFCTYLMDPFSHSHSELNMKKGILKTHSSQVPTEECPRIESAIDMALEHVLGPVQSKMVWSLAKIDLANNSELQGMLSWLQVHMPLSAVKIIEKAKAIYKSFALN